MNHSRYGDGAKAKPCLSYPIGLTQGTMNQNDIAISTRPELLTATCCHYAYAFSFIKPPTAWSPKDINEMLLASKTFLDTAKKCCEQLEIPLTESNLVNKFEIGNYCVNLELPNSSDVIGKILCTKQPGVSNVQKGLKTFFRRNYRACIFRADRLQILIWKTSGIYYVFDPKGRTEHCKQDINGCASLICLETLKNVICLIVHLSNLKSDEFFVLKEIRVNTLKKTNAINKFKCQTKKGPDPSFVTISDRVAILYGSFNVSNACFKETRNCQTLTSCCVAYIYSLIHPPNTWTQSCVDKVLLFGNQMYQECVKCKIPEQFTVCHIPTIVSLGPYRAAIAIRPYQCGGRLQHTADQSNSELFKSMCCHFTERSSCLLQVDQLHFAVWMRGPVYYLFDPYGWNNLDESTTKGVANLQIHSTLESLCCTLYGNLVRIAEKERFYLHDLTSSILSETCGDSNIIEICEDTCLNESIDDLYTPKLDCKPEDQSSNKLCNLDSPTISATQFIRPWDLIKDDNCMNADSDNDSDKEDEPDKNNDLGIDEEQYADLLDSGLTEADIRCMAEMGLTPDEMKQWADLGLGPEDIARLQAAGIDINEYMAMHQLGFTIDDCVTSKELGIPPKLFDKLKKDGISPDQMNDVIAASESLQRFKEMELNQCEIDRLAAAEMSPEEYDEATRALGLTYEEVQRALEAGMTPEEFARQKELGLTSADIIRAKELNMTPEEYAALKAKGLTPEDIDKMAKQGLTPDQMLTKANEKLGLTPDDIQKAKELNMTPEQYAELKAKGKLPSQLAAEAKAKETLPDKAPLSKAHADLGLTAADVQRAKELNMTPEQYAALKAKGMTPEAIAEMSKQGLTPEQMHAKVDEQAKKDALHEDTNKDIQLLQTIIGPDIVAEPESSPDGGEGKSSASVIPISSEEDERRGKSSNGNPCISVFITDKDTGYRPDSECQDDVKFNMTVIKSAKMSPISFQKMLNESFKVVDRVMILNSNNQPNCVAFWNCEGAPGHQYYLYEGCSCNVHHVRRLVLARATSCMTPFKTMQEMIKHIIKRLKHCLPPSRPGSRYGSNKPSSFVQNKSASVHHKSSNNKSRSTCHTQSKSLTPNKPCGGDTSNLSTSDEFHSGSWCPPKICRKPQPPNPTSSCEASSVSGGYAREKLDEKLDALDKRFDELLTQFQSFAYHKK